jgi:hypothetical protein
MPPSPTPSQLRDNRLQRRKDLEAVTEAMAEASVQARLRGGDAAATHA